MCFGYAVLSALESAERHASRPHQYDQYFQTYGLQGIRYPVEIADIPAIEELLQVRINLFTFFDDQGRARQPIYVSKKEFQKEIDLLY